MGTLADQWESCARAPNNATNWELLLKDHGAVFERAVMRVAHRFGVNTIDDINDALQEACLNLSAKARSGRIPEQLDDDHLEAYLKACVANAAHDYFRKRRALRRDILASVPLQETRVSNADGSAAVDLDREVLLHEVEQMIGGSQRDRDVFLMYYRHGWTAKEISTIPSIGLTPKGVESLLQRMITALRNRVKPPQTAEKKKDYYG
jgi:RNA polymerase sigma-70 factor, ECF subfamily